MATGEEERARKKILDRLRIYKYFSGFTQSHVHLSLYIHTILPRESLHLCTSVFKDDKQADYLTLNDSLCYLFMLY